MFLDHMQVDVKYTVAKLVKPENYDAFIAAVKEYMDSLPHQGFISFTDKYEKLYRIDHRLFNNKKKAN